MVSVGIQAEMRMQRAEARPRYTAPPDSPQEGDKLESTNFENTAVFLVSCFQYILVAAVFSIGPPYRKPMWTNGEK